MKNIRDFLTPLNLTITCNGGVDTHNVTVIFNGPASWVLDGLEHNANFVYTIYDNHTVKQFTTTDVLEHPAFEEYIRLSYLELEQSNEVV